MKKTQNQHRPRYIAPELPEEELKEMLSKIGEHILKKRQSLTTQDRFGVEINISRTEMWKSEKGKNVSINILLRILYGLRMQPANFFKDIRFKETKK